MKKKKKGKNKHRIPLMNMIPITPMENHTEQVEYQKKKKNLRTLTRLMILGMLGCYCYCHHQHHQCPYPCPSPDPSFSLLWFLPNFGIINNSLSFHHHNYTQYIYTYIYKNPNNPQNPPRKTGKIQESGFSQL